VLDLKPSIALWSSVYAAPIIGVVAILALDGIGVMRIVGKTLGKAVGAAPPVKREAVNGNGLAAASADGKAGRRRADSGTSGLKSE
ncbi:hypothetical protein HK101_006824, partial [Irineochytrium annulatum]